MEDEKLIVWIDRHCFGIQVKKMYFSDFTQQMAEENDGDTVSYLVLDKNTEFKNGTLDFT